MNLIEIIFLLSFYSIFILSVVYWFFGSQMSKLKLSKINDFIKLKENEMEQNFFNKYKLIEDANINISLDLKRYHQLKKKYIEFNEEANFKGQDMNSVLSQQNQFLELIGGKTIEFNKRLSDLNEVHEAIKKLGKDIFVSEKRTFETIDRIQQFEKQFDNRIENKVKEISKEYTEIIEAKKAKLNKNFENLELKFNHNFEQMQLEGDKKLVQIVDQFEEAEMGIKDKMDLLIVSEKERLAAEISTLSEDSKEKLFEFSANLEKEEKRQNELFENNLRIEKEVEDHKQNLKGKIDGLAETILESFKEKIDDYQEEIVNSLQDKFANLDGKIQKWDQYLSDKEKEIVGDIDFKFDTVKESFESYQQVLEKEVGQLKYEQNDLKKQFVQVHEDQLEQMMVRIEEFKNQLVELEQKNTEKKGLFEDLQGYIDQTKLTLTEKLDLFTKFMEENKEKGRELFQKNYSVISQAYQDLKSKIDETVNQLPEIKEKISRVESEWEDKVEEEYNRFKKEVQSDFSQNEKNHLEKISAWLNEFETSYQGKEENLKTELAKIDVLQNDFKKLIINNKESVQGLTKRIQNEEVQYMARLNKLTKLEQDQTELAKQLSFTQEKINDALKEVGQMEEGWLRLQGVLSEVEEKHLLKLETHFKELNNKTEEEFERFVSHLDGKEAMVPNNPFYAKLGHDSTTTTNQGSGEYKVKMEEKFVELQNSFHERFDYFLEEIAKEKSNQIEKINESVAEFFQKVELKEKKLLKLEDFEKEYVQLVEKKKEEMSDRTDEIYQHLEGEMEVRFNKYIEKMESQVGNELEVKREDLESITLAFLEDQKDKLIEYQNLIKDNFDINLKDNLAQLERGTHQDFDKLKKEMETSLNREKQFLEGALDEIEKNVNSKMPLFQSFENRLENIIQTDEAQRKKLQETEKLINENRALVKEKLQAEDWTSKIFNDLKEEISTEFLKKELSSEFDEYRKELVEYRQKWEKLHSDIDEKQIGFKDMINVGQIEMDQMLKKSKVYFLNQEKELKNKFDEMVKLIEAEMGEISEQIKTLLDKSETIDRMKQFQDDFKNSMEQYQSNLKYIKTNQDDFEKLQKEIKEIKKQDQELKKLYDSMEKKENKAGELEEKLVQILSLSKETDEKLKQINKTGTNLLKIESSIKTFKQEVDDVQNKVQSLAGVKAKYEEVKDLMGSLELEAARSKDRSDLLIDKIENEENQQTKIDHQLNLLEDKSILLENKYKIIDEFSERYDQLDIAILDIEKRSGVVENLRKELANEKDELESIKSVFNEQIGVTIDLIGAKNVEKTLKSKYPTLIKTLHNIGWTEKQIAQHLKIDLTQVRFYIKR